MKSKKLLFIDDNVLTCKYFKLAVGNQYDVTTASTIEDSLKAIKRSETFDVIVSDYKFDNHNGEMNGLDLLNKAREQKGNTFLVLCSAYDEVSSSLSGHNAGILFLRKPLDYALLEREVSSYFSKNPIDKTNNFSGKIVKFGSLTVVFMIVVSLWCIQ